MSRPLSLTARLALLFSGVAVVTLLAVGLYLYQMLARQMSQRDDLELVAKVAQLRQLVQEMPSPQALAADPRMLREVLMGHNDFILRLTGPDGAPLVQLAEPSRELPAMDSVPLRRPATLADVRDWRPMHGGGRMLSADGTVGGAQGQPVRITLARERSDRLKILVAYTRDLAWALGIGAALATLLGYAVVRFSMRPLRSVVAKADAISTSRLNTRLSVQDAPVELRELGMAFNAMLDRLEDGVQRLSGFAADLAHDLRTPINTLMVETQVALSRPRTVDEYQQLLVSNSEEYERLARMVENTLFLARADNAQLALKREDLDLEAELGRIHEYFELLAEDARVTLTVHAAGLHASADPVLLQRALGNLLSNALRHTPPGGAVRLAARAVAGGVQLEVGNSGDGIPPAHLPHIFDRYYRGDAARSASAHSAGLGLAIVRAIMELHDGKVWAENAPRPDGGVIATFFLFFPAQQNN
ncbi:heavy metal sensor histidine kinase [Oxalobacteraceae bacterium A2-2]